MPRDPLAFRKDHIDGLANALLEDEFSDTAQYEKLEFPHLSLDILTLVHLFLPKEGPGVEVGPGSTPLRHPALMTYVEPAVGRLSELAKALPDCDVFGGWAEHLPIPDNHCQVVVMLNGFFQVRSDYEAILEFNRVLKVGGRLIFNIHTSDEADIIVGRVLGARNTVRQVCQFGFRLLCLWEGAVGADRYGVADRQALLVFEKVRGAVYADLNMPQLTPYSASPEGQLYVGRNIDLEGRERHLA